MWPYQQRRPSTTSSSSNPMSRDLAADEDEDVRTQGQLPVFGSALQGPGIPIEDLADFSELLTKPETITESPGAQDWDSNPITLSNVRSVVIGNPSHRLQRKGYSSTSTSLPRSKPATSTQTSGSKKVKPHQEFFKDIIADSMKISGPNQPTNENFERLRGIASSLAATALAPSTNDRYGRAWGRFKTFCSENNCDPLSVEGPVIAAWIVSRAEETDSPNVLESDLKSIKSFRLAAKAPIKNYYIATATMEGCQKRMEAKSRVRLPIDPDAAHMLIRIALQEHGHHSFVGIRQATLYALKYYLTARFEEVSRLELRQIVTRGESLEVTFLKGKKNQKKRAQRSVIHPISSNTKGQTCPVYLIQKYLAHRVSLGHSGPNDFIFPLVGAKWQRVNPTYFVEIRVPVESMSYDVYRGLLKKHLDTKAMKDLGLSPGDYSTHSFRKGGLSMLADGDMHPVYIQKSARHKRIESSVPYIESSLYKALKANDLLSGTEPAEGWSSRYSGNKKSLSRFLTKKFIKDLPSETEAPPERSNSETSLFSGSSSLQEDPSFQRSSQLSGQSLSSMEQDTRELEVTQTSESSSLLQSNLNLDVLDSLCKNWNIQVTYPAEWQKK